MTPSLWVALAVALFGGGAIGGILVKYMNRGVDMAQAEKLHAETRQSAQQTSAGEVQTIRDVLTEVRGQAAEKADEIAELKADMRFLKDRVAKLEERERHMLTRAAVHEAWDQMAFAALVAMNPQHPPPPPLVLEQDHAGYDDKFEPSNSGD